MSNTTNTTSKTQIFGALTSGIVRTTSTTFKAAAVVAEYVERGVEVATAKAAKAMLKEEFTEEFGKGYTKGVDAIDYALEVSKVDNVIATMKQKKSRSANL